MGFARMKSHDAEEDAIAPLLDSERILIAEQDAGGHRLVYVRLLALDALSAGTSVTLALTERVLADERFRLHLAELADTVEVVPLVQHATLRVIQTLAKAAGASIAVVPDGLQYGLDLVAGRRLHRGPQLRIVVMNDPRWRMESHEGLHLREHAKLLLFKIAERRRSQDLFWLRSAGHSSQNENVVSDPVVLDGTSEQIQLDSKLFREQHGMSSDAFWFGVVGSLEKRKNIPMIARACHRLVSVAPQPVGLALLGPWAEDTAPPEDEMAMATALGVKVVRHHVHMTNYEMNVALAALDCIVLAYSTTAPNSTMAKASALGVKVVAAGPPSFRRFAKELTGYSGVPLRVSDIGVELLRAMESPQPHILRPPDTSGFTSPLLRRPAP